MTLTAGGTPDVFNGHGWTITSHKYPISDAEELHEIQSQLHFPVPEMTYGNNKLVLRHNSTGWEYVFETLGALQAVRAGEEASDTEIKVGHADAWLKSRYI